MKKSPEPPIIIWNDGSVGGPRGWFCEFTDDDGVRNGGPLRGCEQLTCSACDAELRRCAEKNMHLGDWTYAIIVRPKREVLAAPESGRRDPRLGIRSREPAPLVQTNRNQSRPERIRGETIF